MCPPIEYFTNSPKENDCFIAEDGERWFVVHDFGVEVVMYRPLNPPVFVHKTDDNMFVDYIPSDDSDVY